MHFNSEEDKVPSDSQRDSEEHDLSFPAEDTAVATMVESVK